MITVRTDPSPSHQRISGARIGGAYNIMNYLVFRTMFVDVVQGSLILFAVFFGIIFIYKLFKF